LWSKAERIASLELIKTLRIKNDLGLHARAAAKIVELSKQYKSKLFLNKNGHEVDGSSILAILTLACPKGTEVQVRIVGEDSEELLERLSDLFEEKFGETK
jgi:phosphocarrier protein